MTYDQVWRPILGICAVQLTHPKSTYTAVNTHTPLGVWCLAQEHLSRCIEGGESAVHSLHPPTILAGPRLKVNWHQACNMISYKRDVVETQSLSELKLGRGSPICERVCKKIVEYFKNNVPQRQIAKALQISSSTVHNIIKRLRELDLCA